MEPKIRYKAKIMEPKIRI